MDSVCLHHPKVAFRAHTHTFRLPHINPLLVKYMSNWRELVEPFPNGSWPLFLLFLLIARGRCSFFVDDYDLLTLAKSSAWTWEMNPWRFVVAFRQHIVSDIKYKLVPLFHPFIHLALHEFHQFRQVLNTWNKGKLRKFRLTILPPLKGGKFCPEDAFREARLESNESRV